MAAPSRGRPWPPSRSRKARVAGRRYPANPHYRVVRCSPECGIWRTSPAEKAARSVIPDRAAEVHSPKWSSAIPGMRYPRPPRLRPAWPQGGERQSRRRFPNRTRHSRNPSTAATRHGVTLVYRRCNDRVRPDDPEGDDERTRIDEGPGRGPRRVHETRLVGNRLGRVGAVRPGPRRTAAGSPLRPAPWPATRRTALSPSDMVRLANLRGADGRRWGHRGGSRAWIARLVR